MDNKTCR